MKALSGIVTSVKMKDTVVVEVTRRVPHPLYKKLMKRSKKYKVHAPANTYTVGQALKIVETKPITKDKHFAVYAEKKEKKA